MSSLTDSIMLTVKKMLGIAQEYNAFDIDIIVDINSVFLALCQLGVGPKIPFQIQGEEETWSDFLGEDKEILPGVQTYVYLKTRMIFDPPTQSYVADAMQKQCDEFEWRFREQVEGGEVTHDSPEERARRIREERKAKRSGRIDPSRHIGSKVGKA